MPSTKNQAKPKYITPDSRLGKFALQYIYKICETALDYCQEQGLTEFEDFATAVTTISEEQNPDLKINTAISETGIALRLAKKPEIGYTTGTYLMKYLGFEGEKQKKFTRKNVEAFLSPQLENETSDNLLKLLKNQLQDENQTQNRSASNNLDDLDDLLDSEETSKSPPSKLSQKNQKPQSQPIKSPEQPLKKKSLDIDNILDRAAEISMATTAQTNEVDGLALGGLASTTTILAAVVGKKAAEKIVNAAQKLKRQGQVAKIAARLKAAQERTDELIEKEELLAEFIEETSEQNQSEQEDKKESLVVETKEESEESTPGEILAQAVSDIEQRITQSKLNGQKTVPFTIDKNADFDEQLKQINAALDRIEQRLDELEKRITALEQLMGNPTQSQSQPSPFLSNLENSDRQTQTVTIPQQKETGNFWIEHNGKFYDTAYPLPDRATEVKAHRAVGTTTLYFDGESRDNLEIAAGGAVLITPDGETHTVSEFLDRTTHDRAEYCGLINGLKKAKELGCQNLDIKSDSQLLVKQILGEVQVKDPAVASLHQEAIALIEQFNRVDLSCIEPNQNILAKGAVDRCIEKALQGKQTLPTENSDTDTTEATDASPPPQASKECASALLILYNQAEEQAIACEDSLEDGVLLGDDAVLFVDREADSVRVSIEHFNGEELFVATLTDREWAIERDRLSEETKEAIASLSDRELEFESVKPDNKKERKSSEMEM